MRPATPIVLPRRKENRSIRLGRSTRSPRPMGLLPILTGQPWGMVSPPLATKKSQLSLTSSGRLEAVRRDRQMKIGTSLQKNCDRDHTGIEDPGVIAKWVEP